jgi:hypothetical protein
LGLDRDIDISFVFLTIQNIKSMSSSSIPNKSASCKEWVSSNLPQANSAETTSRLPRINPTPAIIKTRTKPDPLEEPDTSSVSVFIETDSEDEEELDIQADEEENEEEKASEEDRNLMETRSRNKDWYPISYCLENTGSVARDHLANERTALAWIRTSLSLT